MKNRKKIDSLLGLALFVALLSSCDNPKSKNYRSHSIFTKTDSLRASYISIQDTIVFYVNRMSSEYNNRKIALLKLTEKLEQYGYHDSLKLTNLKERIIELKEDGISAQKLYKENWVTAYDNTFDSLQNELLTTASEIKESEKLEKLFKAIYNSEAKAIQARERYNSVAKDFNHFIDKYNHLIKEITYKDSVPRCPLVESK